MARADRTSNRPFGKVDVIKHRNRVMRSNKEVIEE